MAVSSRTKISGNIFEVLDGIKAKILDDPVTYSSQEYALLFKAIETYFRSNRWAHNEKERMIYIYSCKGMRTAQVAENLGMNINTYRSSVSRVSSRIKTLLFNDKDVYDLLLSSDIKTISRLRKNIDFLNMSFDIYSEFDASLVKKIESFRTDCDGDFTDEEYYQAVLFLCSFNMDVIESRLSKLNPSVLSYVMNELSSSELTNAMIHYNALKKEAMKPKVLSDAFIGKCNNLTGGHR